ncbi:MAG: U32 family peptidase [SAR324 cluster bacterium]|nr:U32 family peptidase [SAR324 cluster bacterium]
MLKYNTYFSDPQQLQQLKKSPVREVILEHSVLSRFGFWNTETLLKWADILKNEGFELLLQWDILTTQDGLRECLDVIQQLPLHWFKAIRVKDLGAAQWLLENRSEGAMHLLLDTGNHNLFAVKRWQQYFKGPLKRVVLSSELPGYRLKEYTDELEIPSEVLGVGKILFFYTPRQLLTPLGFEKLNGNIQMTAQENLTFQRHFPTIENQHGTFMFHDRDLFLLDQLDEVQATGIDTLRLDLRFGTPSEWIHELAQLNSERGSALKNKWPIKTTHGFFRTNRTDKPIELIKNKYLKLHQGELLGQVVEAVKGDYIALMSRKPFDLGDHLLMITPAGKKIEVTLSSIQTISGKSVQQAQDSGLWLIPHQKFVTQKSLVYKIIEDL